MFGFVPISAAGLAEKRYIAPKMDMHYNRRRFHLVPSFNVPPVDVLNE